MNPPQPGAGNPGGMFFGMLLMAIGGLITLLCGLCSAGFLWLMMSESRNGGDIAGSLVTVGIIGGVPIIVGVTLFLVGRGLYRSSKPKPDPNVFN
jgi:hypothetical protein